MKINTLLNNNTFWEQNREQMKWMNNKKIGIYQTHADTTGRPGSPCEALLWGFEPNLPHIIALRSLDFSDPANRVREKEIKSQLTCGSFSAWMPTRSKSQASKIEYTGLLQLDFDYYDIKDYDVEELKAAAFDLPFVVFAGLSCTGRGFYILILIAEPEKLSKYAEHCFIVFEEYGIKPDRSKGRNPNDLRYLSYDSNMMWKEDAEPLFVTHFKTDKKPSPIIDTNTQPTVLRGNAVLNKAIQQIQTAPIGSRWQTVQKWAYTLGGLNDNSLLDHIKAAIHNSSQYTGLESKYCECADVCFRDGLLKPIAK